MRRGRAWVISAGFMAVLAIATASSHSDAAGPGPWTEPVFAPPDDDAAPLAPAAPEQPSLAPGREAAAVFGSLIEPAPVPTLLPNDEACPSDMVEVEGDYCPYVAQTCLHWMDPEMLQCSEFAHAPPGAASPAGAPGETGDAPLGSKCSMKTQHKRFCMDRYEWPNKRGAMPVYMTSWVEAKASCEGIGKRLCADTEWTLACEGPQRQPYPYGDGYVRDDTACNIDKPYIWPHPERIYDASRQDEELARLDQREPSGSRAACVSPYGVHDMVGNVDEWVVNESQGAKPFRSGLKGGYWGPVRTRCRPMTTAHDETFRYYQIGFRCCSDSHDVETSEVRLAKE
jgi:sulfatase modifying factor 1